MKSKALLIGAVCFGTLATLYSQQQATVPAYKNPQLPIERRVNDLISRMTLEEKVSQLGHTAQAIPRLRVPEYNWWSEGLHGVAFAGHATVFPQAIGLAATFDDRLMHQIADVISTEFRAKYYASLHPDGSSDGYRGLTVWSPNMNIFRDPRWGRGQETYGEDPYLTSQMGVAFVTGMQGDDPRYLKTVATSKHFAVHSGPETTRHNVDVHASRHDMEDTYLPAFRAAVMESKVDSVMCAYNSVNGQPACANATLLQEHLRTDWGFQGYVVSDCGAVEDIFSGHHFTESMEEAAAVAFKAGMDLVCGWPESRVAAHRNAILEAVKQGLLPEADLDRSLQRLFTARMRLGMFDPSSMVPYSRITTAENDTEVHRQLALKAARESIVVLKNKNDFLPLKGKYATIAVIGPDADNFDALTGNYNGTPSNPVTILAGVCKRFAESHVVYAEGTGLIGPAEKPEAEADALARARAADLIILAMGLSPKIEGEEMKINAEGFLGGDRTSLDLPAPQENLIRKITAMGKPTVLVLTSGSALAANWEDENLSAILEAWYPGEEGGTAVAEALAGDFSPGGCLPVTFYKSVDQLPAFDDYSMAGRTYRYFHGEPLYPFGFGLSYTSFEYRNATVDNAQIAADGAVKISVEVSNTGAMAGDAVVQLYLTHEGVADAPLRALEGFERIHLDPHQKQTVSFTLNDRKLSIVDPDGRRRIVPGKVDVWVGGGQSVTRTGLPKPNGAGTQFRIMNEANLAD